jgi:Rieske Fe-S protein
VAGFVTYRPKIWLTVGTLQSMPEDGFAAFQQGERTAFLRKTSDGGIEALSQRCSHQGCLVTWNAAENEFRCPCHRGAFDRTGTPIAGPPKRPLERYETRTENGSVQVFL